MTRYRAFNENIVVIKPTETVTDSGIIVAEQDNGQQFTFTVVETTEITAELQGKTIVAPRHKVYELPATTDGKRYAVMNYKDISVIVE